MTSLFFGEHQLAVSENFQHSAAAQAQLYFFDSGLLFQLAFQAPGLTANVGSKETTLDINLHGCTILTDLDAIRMQVVRSQREP